VSYKCLVMMFTASEFDSLTNCPISQNMELVLAMLSCTILAISATSCM